MRICAFVLTRPEREWAYRSKPVFLLSTSCDAMVAACIFVISSYTQEVMDTIIIKLGGSIITTKNIARLTETIVE